MDKYNSTTNHTAYTDTTNPRLLNGIIVLLLLVLNLSGNSVVFYIYSFRVKASVFSFFVTTLAGLDIITALTTMLLDAIIKVRPLDEDRLDLNTLCKITHFQVYSHSLISGCVLTLIAYQRYRKICHPLKPSLTMKMAKLALVVIVLFCILLSVCTLVINGPKDIPVKIGDHVINITICRYDQKYEGKIYQTVFSFILLSAFTIVLCLTIIFYVMVAKSLKKFFDNDSRRISMSSPVTLETDIQNKNHVYSEDSAEQRRRQYQQQCHLARMSIMSSGGNSERISSQMYRVFAIITLVFIVSYLPHLIVLILTKSLQLDSQILTNTERILMDLAYNCPYISTVANPIIYGFRSAEFREHCKIIFTSRQWRRRRAYRR
ncbi:unnamed protein product [Candidula unifasciata]|uniref:G-protein coupled receptors family 1 profile domain-containing protein n=1 Tax=Candidula unifasciata TaxID=100452 RepID=A0A8S3ZVM7_9EUPU|nr:unnamed protein product [Candidula unifasciata]